MFFTMRRQIAAFGLAAVDPGITSIVRATQREHSIMTPPDLED
jgi:hypothetical protein